MKKILQMWPLFLFIFIIDRLMFLPGRMNGEWEYVSGTYLGDTIAFEDNISILNNINIEIQKNKQFDTFYLMGCYFGQLYLLNKNTLEFTHYVRSSDDTDWF